MQNEIARACEYLSCTPYDVIEQAHCTLEEDLQDVIDPRDVFRLYIETGSAPDWVYAYVLDVIHNDPN